MSTLPIWPAPSNGRASTTRSDTLPEPPPDMARAAGPPTAVAGRLADAGIERLLTLNDLAVALSCSRRALERLRSAGKLPPPDARIGRLVRWKPMTIRRWIDAGAKGGG